MKILTANRLTDGAVVWLGEHDLWSPDFASAALLDAATADGALATAQDDPGLLVAPYLVEVEADASVEKRERLRETIRAGGPTAGHSSRPRLMYRYDEFDARLVRERIAQFRDQIERRLDGRLTEDQFKPLRLMNGVYLQLHAYMLRVAIPYGEMNARQLRALAHIARTYDKGYGHFTTRSNIQFNWPALVDVPAILETLAEVEMHAIQTSGNCIRNVTTDPYAGVAADEVEDPRAWAELIRQWSTFHPEFSFLPRKFKIAVIGAPKDRAAMRTHDVGLEAVRDVNSGLGFRLFAGGGQGRTPYIGQEVSPFVPAASLFAYLTALLRVYNRHGRRDNIHKARIKILVAALGIEKFREEVEAEFDALPKATLALPRGEAERIAAYFAPPAFEAVPERNDAFDRALFADADFARWTHSNLKPHKQPGYGAVVVSLKPVGGVPGDATADQLDLVADLSERFSFGQARAAYDQNLILPHVRLDATPALFRALADAGLATANSGLAGDIIACPASTTAASPTRARSRSPRPCRGGWPIPRFRPRSGRCASTSRAASTPAAITTSATSASSASISRAKSSTRSRWVDRATRPRRSARSWARVWPATTSRRRSSAR